MQQDAPNSLEVISITKKIFKVLPKIFQKLTNREMMSMGGLFLARDMIV